MGPGPLEVGQGLFVFGSLQPFFTNSLSVISNF